MRLIFGMQLERWPQKNGRQPKQKWKTTSKKMGDNLKKEFEDDLKKKMEDNLKNKIEDDLKKNSPS